MCPPLVTLTVVFNTTVENIALHGVSPHRSFDRLYDAPFSVRNSKNPGDTRASRRALPHEAQTIWRVCFRFSLHVWRVRARQLFHKGRLCSPSRFLPSPAIRRTLAFDYCAVYPPIGSCFKEECESTSSGTSGRPSPGKHLRALHSVVESFRLFSVASRATSETAPTQIWNTSQISLQHSTTSEVTCLRRVPGDEPSKLIPRPSALRRSTPFRDCGGYSRWEQQLYGCRRSPAALRRVGFSAQELDSCSVRWRSGFPRIAGPPVLSSGCWVHDRFQMLSELSHAPTLSTLCICQAATEHRINIAHLVLHPIWNGELSSGEREPKRTQTQSTIREDARTNTLCDMPAGCSSHAFEFCCAQSFSRVRPGQFLKHECESGFGAVIRNGCHLAVRRDNHYFAQVLRVQP